MTDDETDPVDSTGELEISDAMLERLTDQVREDLYHGILGPESGIGISLDELELDAEGPVVTATLGDEVLLEHSFEPESWETVDPDDPGYDPVAMAEELTLEISDRVDLKRLLVERRRDRLADLVVDESEDEITARLEAAAPEIEWDVSVDVVELPYEYHHGDPDWVYEQGYPPYGLEVTSWDPDAEVVVEIIAETPEAESLIDEAVERLLEAVGDG